MIAALVVHLFGPETAAAVAAAAELKIHSDPRWDPLAAANGRKPSRRGFPFKHEVLETPPRVLAQPDVPLTCRSVHWSHVSQSSPCAIGRPRRHRED